MKFFSVDSHLYRFLSRFLDVLKLNFMWLVFCIPIITIGASTVAAFTVALRMVDDEEGYVARGFVKAFKENFKQGTMLFIITVVAVYAVYLDFQLFEAVEGNPIIFLIIGIVSCFIVGLSLLYAYPLIARYDNSIIKTIQNSFEISKRYFPRTIFLIIIVLFELFIFQYNSTMLFFGILIGPAFVIFTIAAFSKRTFQQIEKDNNN